MEVQRKHSASLPSVLRQSWSEDAAQCVHLADGETEASKGAVTQREEHGHRTECGGLL